MSETLFSVSVSVSLPDKSDDAAAERGGPIDTVELVEGFRVLLDAETREDRVEDAVECDYGHY